MLEIRPGGDPATPRDAATVILLRDVDGGGFETFMVRRHIKSGFMGGATVFPGGKLDPDDSSDAILEHIAGRTAREAADALNEPDDERRALGLYVAAVRETFEEAGVLLADIASGTDLDGARKSLEGGADFSHVIGQLGATLQLDRMHPWARWVTPRVEPRRFDARFFIAICPSDQEPLRDQRETTDSDWLTPTIALSRAEAGDIQLPPPTLRNLELLAKLESTDAVVEMARAGRPQQVEPVFFDWDGRWALALPGDPEHPITESIVAGGSRFVLEDMRWRSTNPDDG
jgi:8-oxo-dGTP pyrophosphatase MutT (NUDIX family)